MLVSQRTLIPKTVFWLYLLSQDLLRQKQNTYRISLQFACLQLLTKLTRQPTQQALLNQFFLYLSHLLSSYDRKLCLEQQRVQSPIATVIALSHIKFMLQIAYEKQFFRILFRSSSCTNGIAKPTKSRFLTPAKATSAPLIAWQWTQPRISSPPVHTTHRFFYKNITEQSSQ